MCEKDRQAGSFSQVGSALHAIPRDPGKWTVGCPLQDCVERSATQSRLRTGSGFAGPGRTDQPLKKLHGNFFRQPGRPRMRLATTLSCTSLVPPSIELPLVRIQVRAAAAFLRARAFPLQRVGAAGGHHQFPAPLVQLGAVVLQARRHGGMRLAAARLLAHQLDPGAEGRLVHFEARDLGAQHRIVQAPGRVACPCVRRRSVPPAAAASARRWRRSSRARASAGTWRWSSRH